MTLESGSQSKQSGSTTPPCMIFVDKNGGWFHQGVPIIHQGFLQLFYDSLHTDEDGNYLIRFKNQVCRLDVEDTPFVVLRIDYLSREEKDQSQVVLHLVNGKQEALDPGTLFIGPENVLYCTIRDGQFRARFSRPSYYQLAAYIEEEEETGKFYFSLNGRKYYLQQESEKNHDGKIAEQKN